MNLFPWGELPYKKKGAACRPFKGLKPFLSGCPAPKGPQWELLGYLRLVLSHWTGGDVLIQNCYLLGIKSISSHLRILFLLGILFKISDEQPRSFYMGDRPCQDRLFSTNTSISDVKCFHVFVCSFFQGSFTSARRTTFGGVVVIGLKGRKLAQQHAWTRENVQFSPFKRFNVILRMYTPPLQRNFGKSLLELT